MSLWGNDQRIVRLGFLKGLTKGELWFNELGTHGVACTGVVAACSCTHVTHGVARTGVVAACSCIRVTRGVLHTGGMVACSCIRVTHGMVRIIDVHVTRGVVCTGEMVSCSCIHVTCEVMRSGDFVSCSCIRGTREVTCTRDVVSCPCIRGTYEVMLLHTWHLWHVLETWCSCIHVTCGVTHIGDFGARMRAHHGWSLGLKSLGVMTTDVPVLTRKLWKERDVEFHSMYLIEYKFASLSHICLVKTS